MLADFHFLRPWWLLALVPAALILFLLIRNKYRHAAWSEVCDAELLPFILQDQPLQTHRYRWLATALATLLCILAGAGPTWERLPSPAFRNDSALVIALDLSKSMDATDIKPSRISRARYKISDILRQRKDGQTALLVYSGDAFTVTPLTTDTATINSQLEALNTDIMPSPGSNAGVAIEKAVDLLRQAGLAQGHVLLVTDDGADADSIERAREVLGDYRLSVLAFGTAEGAPIPVNGGGFLKDRQGNIVIARLDSAELSELASVGQGVYQAVTANDDDVKRLGDLFNTNVNRDQVEQSDLRLENWDEKGPWLLLLALPWAALRFRRGLLAFLLVLCLPFPNEAWALDWQSLWQTQDQRAQQAFLQQQYQEAAQQFNDPNWRAAAQYKAGQYQQAAETLKESQSADGHYNRGNALAKAGRLQEALDAYNEVLKLDPQHADARYNKELVEKALKKQQNQDNPSSKQSSSEQNKPQADQSKQQNQNEQDSNEKDSKANQQNQDQTNQQAGEDKSAGTPHQNQDKNPQREQETEKPDDARRSSDNPKPEHEQEPQKESVAKTNPEQDETKRANEQLLRRIPDEPTGLLKRKFKYQYGQRDPPPHSGPAW